MTYTMIMDQGGRVEVKGNAHSINPDLMTIQVCDDSSKRKYIFPLMNVRYFFVTDN